MNRLAHLLVLGLALGGCFGGASAAGIHARMAYSAEGGLRVVEVPDGPARQAGLAPDDRIVAIDGHPVAGLGTEEVVERLRGPVGSEVLLDVQRGSERHEIVVRRTPYDLPAR